MEHSIQIRNIENWKWIFIVEELKDKIKLKYYEEQLQIFKKSKCSLK